MTKFAILTGFTRVTKGDSINLVIIFVVKDFPTWKLHRTDAAICLIIEYHLLKM